MKIQIPKPRNNMRSTFFTDRARTQFKERQTFSKKNILRKFEEKHLTKIVKAIAITIFVRCCSSEIFEIRFFY